MASNNENKCLKEALDMTMKLVPIKSEGGFWADIRQERKSNDLLRFSIFVGLAQSVCNTKIEDSDKMIARYKELQKKLD